jgi:hypothetical protein
MELSQHLKNINDNLRENGSYFLVVEDLDHWAQYGVYSVEQFERYELESTYYELYKDVNGISPRWVQFDQLSNQDLENMIESLQNEMNLIVQREEEEDSWYYFDPETYILADEATIASVVNNQQELTNTVL